MEFGNNKVNSKVASNNKVASSNKLGTSANKLGNGGNNRVGNVNNKVDNRVSDEVNKVGDKVGNEGGKGDEVGSSNKDEEDNKKVDGEDEPAKVSIDKEMTNLLNNKPKPPKAKFRVKDAIRAKFGPDIEYTISIAVEAENGSTEEIIMAKNIKGN